MSTFCLVWKGNDVAYMTENYGRAFEDATEASRLDPSNTKAYYRAAKACSALRKWTTALHWISLGLQVEPTNTALLQEQTRAETALQKQKEIEVHKIELSEKVQAAIRARGIRYEPEAKLEVSSHQPTLDNDELFWPVLLVADAANVVECAGAVSENASLRDVLQMIYREPPQFDPRYRYSPKMVAFYSTNSDTWRPAPLDIPLGKVLARKDFIVRGLPTFYVFYDLQSVPASKLK